MKKEIFYLFVFVSVLISCHKQDQVTPKEEIPWEKLEGKLVAFDYTYAFVADGKTKIIDTILKQPANLQYGQYYFYGRYGVSFSHKHNQVLYTLTTDIYNSTLQSIQLDGSNQIPIPLHQDPWINSPVENREGSIAYFIGVKNSSEIESLWVDQKKMFTFSIHKVSPLYYLDWHPSNEFLLVGLNDDNVDISFPSLTEINVKDSTLHVVLEAKPSTLYYLPHYSPDGNRIVFIKVTSISSQICIVNRDGTGLKELVDDFRVFGSYPIWSPKGDKIAYTTNEGIFIMNDDGTDNTLIFKGDPNRWNGNGLLWLP